MSNLQLDTCAEEVNHKETLPPETIFYRLRLRCPSALHRSQSSLRYELGFKFRRFPPHVSQLHRLSLGTRIVKHPVGASSID
jgi:hypothetical protein